MIIEPPWTDDDVRALQQRNAERVRVAIEQLGAAWVLYKRPAVMVIDLASEPDMTSFSFRSVSSIPEHYPVVETKVLFEDDLDMLRSKRA